MPPSPLCLISIHVLFVYYLVLVGANWLSRCKSGKLSLTDIKQTKQTNKTTTKNGFEAKSNYQPPNQMEVIPVSFMFSCQEWCELYNVSNA